MATSAPRPRRTGRQRNPDTQQAILRATAEMLQEMGYQRLSIERIAARAGAGKATVYRWWPSKGALVLEATGDHLEIGLVPDTGDTRTDLLAAAEQVIATFTDPIAATVIFVVLAHLEEDPSLAAEFRERWVGPWRSSLAQAVERGIARGDLATDADVAFLVDVLVGIVFQRTLVVPEPMTDGLSEQIVELLLKQ